jgi:hypothetical protein
MKKTTGFRGALGIPVFVLVGVTTSACEEPGTAGGADTALQSDELQTAEAPAAMSGQYELDEASRVCSTDVAPTDVRAPSWGSHQRQFFRFGAGGVSDAFAFRAYNSAGTCWAEVSGSFAVAGDRLHTPTEATHSSCPGGAIVLASSHRFAWTDDTHQAFSLATSASAIGHGICPANHPWLLTRFVAAPRTP